MRDYARCRDRRAARLAVIAAGVVIAGSVGLAGLGPAGLGPGRAAAAVVASGASWPSRPVPGALTATDWPAYLHGWSHSSYNAADTAIKPASVPALVRRWKTPAGLSFLSSPTVADGAVFIAAFSGWFYKLSEATGAVLGKVFIGHQPTRTCLGRGPVGTATVAPDPVTRQDTVYVGGADGYLYAFSAATMALRWKSVIARPSSSVSNYFQWSSPTVAAGRIYIGVSSNCDNPLVRGGVFGYSQATGKKFAAFYTVPRGMVGGSVWSSVAVAYGNVYVTTGNGAGALPSYQTNAIVKLSATTLRLLGWFTVPVAQLTPDADFGASPVIFGGYVGACNKNGIFYAVRRSSMTLAWRARIGAMSGLVPYVQCSAAPVYDGQHLYFGGPAFTIRGRTYRGSVQARNPATGRLLWATGLPAGVIGSPTMNGGRVLAVGTYDYTAPVNATYLVSAATGKVLRTLVKGRDFAQAVFAGGWIFAANNNGLYAFARAS